MGYQVQVAGKTLVKVGTGTAGALENFGYTRQGAETRREAYWINIPGDEHGGDEGPPIDIQYLGEVAFVRCEMTKFDADVFRRIAARVKGATAGVPASAGTLMFTPDSTNPATTNAIRVILSNTAAPVNFPRAIPRAAIELNVGTKYSTALVEFECHKDSNGTLYNTNVS
jgi:hypothetical protein